MEPYNKVSTTSPPALNSSHNQLNIVQKAVIAVLSLLILTAFIFAGYQLVQHRKLMSTVPNKQADSFFGVNETARDTERETDIKSIHAQIEAFWAQVGYYPSLADLNDPGFVAVNLKGLDLGAFKDPQGTTSKLSSTPTAYTYSYEVKPANCDNVKTYCTTYTLTATLEKDYNGSKIYTKTSLNN